MTNLEKKLLFPIFIKLHIERLSQQIVFSPFFPIKVLLVKYCNVNCY